jgi:tetratricopeptide (TPR) repeat protein
MWDLAVREEDYQGADSMMRRMTAPPLSMRMLLTLVRGESAARAGIVEEARASDSRQSQIAARYVATFLEDFATAKSLAELDLAPRRRPPIRANAQLLLAWLEVAGGRWAGAKAAFAQAARMEEVPSVLVQMAIAATLPFLPVPRRDLDSLRREVERWSPRAEVSEPGAGLASRLSPHLRLHLLGLLSSRLGDQAGALRMARDIERAEGPDEARPAIRALALTIRADVALQSQSADEADQALEEVQGEVPLELVSVPLYTTVREFTQEHARHLRVLTLRAQQKHREALQWIETSFQGAPSEIVYLAPMHLAQAEIYERLGEREKAAEHYRRFLVLWRDCDPELRPVLERAKSELARMVAEPR